MRQQAGDARLPSGDSIPWERSLGIEAGLAWGACAQVTVVGVDRGISKGMRYGIERARSEGRPVEWLSLAKWKDSWLPEGVNRDEWTYVHVGPEQITVVP
jgi:hypothetical protein